MFQELEEIKEKYRQLTLSLSDPALVSDPQKVKKVAKERADLEPLVKKYEDYQKIKNDIKESEEILADPKSDSDLKKLAEAELRELGPEEGKIKEELKILLLPKNPMDEKNVFLERLCCLIRLVKQWSLDKWPQLKNLNKLLWCI